MKIGINVSFLRKPGTGIGQVTTHFLQTLFATHPDHEYVLYTEEEIDFDVPQNAEVHVCIVPYNRDDLLRKWVWEKYLLPVEVHKDGCDVLVSMYQSATITKGVRHVMVVHDIIPEILPHYLDNWRKKFYWKSVRAAIRAADHLVTVSSYTRDDIVKHLAIDTAKITPSLIGVDPRFHEVVTDKEMARVFKKYKLPQEYLYCGGGLEVRKNVERVVRAYADLIVENADVPDLVISGTLLPQLAPLVTDVEALVHKLEIGGRVHIIGFVAQEDLPALYAGAKLFLFLSMYEGFGMPVLEAMSVGTPALVTRETSLPEVGGDTVIYAQESQEDLNRQIREILADDEMREQFGRRALERSKEFTWKKFVADVIGATTSK